MMKVRDRNKLDDDPPNYSPGNEYLTVVLKWGGEMRTQPLARKGNVRKFYYLLRGEFRLLSSDEEVRLWCITHLPLKEFVIYFEEEHDGEEHDGNGGVTEHDNSENEGGSGEGRIPSADYKGKAVREDNDGENFNLDDEDHENDGDGFSDSDYKMGEGSTTDDDVIFSQNVCVNVENSESSDHILDEDLVAIEGDFDESKESDEELTGPRYPVFNPDVVFEPHFELGMIFSNMLDFKKVVQSHAIKAKRSVKFTKTAPERVYARCSDKECGWNLNLLKMINEETFQLRVCDDEHTCAPTYELRVCDDEHTCAPTYEVSNLKSRSGLYGKNVSTEKLEGCPDAQFAKLWDYADKIKRTNPGSTVIVGTEDNEDEEKKFSRFYMCLQAVKSGFRDGCRPIIRVDECHLKGPHKGILLTAVGVDANNNLYPIAWAIVNTESRETWGWFLLCMKHDLGLCRGYEYNLCLTSRRD
ncbi:hypothetical protein ACS0TY_027854 [Phlomoides rotata]